MLCPPADSSAAGFFVDRLSRGSLMPRVCSVCTHPDRTSIDQALVSGKPVRETSALFRVSEDALGRHKEGHVPAELAKANDAEEVAHADDLLRELRLLRAKAYSLLLTAERQGDLRTALAGIREARACLELLLEVEGELDRRPTVNLLVAPEWLAVRAALLDALRPFPEARGAVSARLAALYGAGSP